MVLWKIWFDLRKRFLICFLLVSLMTTGLIVLFPLSSMFVNYIKEDLSPEDFATLHKYGADYRLFMDEGWFREIRFMALFGIALSLGGAMTEERSRSVLLTLSLPVSRRKWILSQAIVAAGLVAILTSLAALLVLGGGWTLGQDYPLIRAAGGTLLLVAGVIPWIALSLAITSFTEDKLKAGICALTLWFFTNLLGRIYSIEPWLPESILDLLSPEPFPWRALLSIVVLTAGGLILAIKQFESRDY